MNFKKYVISLEVGRVNFLLLGSSFGFFDFAQVRLGFWFFDFFLRSCSGPDFFIKPYPFELNRGLEHQNFWARQLRSRKINLGLTKYYYGLAQVLQNIAQVGLAKTPLPSGFDPTHP